MSASPQSMREVVQCLLAQQAEALFELRELRLAVHEILESLIELERITQELASDVARMRESSGRRVPIVLAVHERMRAVRTCAAQILAAFRELDRGINGWGVDDDPGSSVSNGSRAN
jgi:hypothetical protein